VNLLVILGPVQKVVLGCADKDSTYLSKQMLCIGTLDNA